MRRALATYSRDYGLGEICGYIVELACRAIWLGNDETIMKWGGKF